MSEPAEPLGRPPGRLRGPVVLVGFMGAGKSTTGRLLAQRLGMSFTDSDEVIEARAGHAVAEIFATGGEQAFRDLEQAVVIELLAAGPGVLALGGGACGRARTRAALAGHTVVHLEVTFAQAMARVGGDGSRPVLARPDVADLHAGRAATYAQVATLAVATDGRSAEEVAAAVLEGLEGLGG